MYVFRDDPGRLSFAVAVDLPGEVPAIGGDLVADAEDQGRREYVTRLTQQRLHQVAFRIRVLRAYQERCAICRLRHTELLDAAHILPDGHPKGEPIVSNGLALCKLHHAAFDRNFLGIRPDYSIEIRHDLLVEHDGPMLQHGLREFHQCGLLVLPRQEALRPNREFLAERYEVFQRG